MYLSDFVGKEDRVEVTFSDFRELVDGCSRLDAIERYLKSAKYIEKSVILSILGVEQDQEQETEKDKEAE